jgi:hypothetical protein
MKWLSSLFLSFKHWPRLDFLLLFIFSVTLVFRVAFPILYSPFDNIFSDTKRHWDSAVHLHEITLFAGIEPKGYQFFLGYLVDLFGNNHLGIEFSIGILCALTGFVWFLIARELLPRTQALLSGIIIGIIPSLLTLYSLFLNETLMLFLLGAAFLFSLICWRRPSIFLFGVSVFFWETAALTRIMALPIGLVMISLLWWHKMGRNWKAGGLSIVISAVLFIPAAQFSYDRINVYTPFAFGGVNKIYSAVKENRIEFHLNDEWWWIESPAYNTAPLDPISDFRLKKTGTYKFKVTTSHGMQSWDEAYQAAKRSYPEFSYTKKVLNNIIYATFSTSWPDNDLKEPYFKNKGFWVRSGYDMRWIWFPLIVFILIGVSKWRYTEPQALFICAALFLLLALYTQNVVIMEGRYRKPIEPMLIISGFIVWLARAKACEQGDAYRSMGSYIGRWFGIFFGIKKFVLCFVDQITKVIRNSRYSQNFLCFMRASSKWEVIFLAGFIQIIILRFCFPLFYSPFDHLFSDPQRHWDNAVQFHQNRLFSGIDPKGYQYFLAGIVDLFKNWHRGIELSIGLLCAGTGLVWFLVARELLPKTQALLAGCVLGIMPSLMTIFGYFMNETLTLFLFGLAWWVSLVCWRRPSMALFMLVVTIWEWAALTRIVALPVGVVMITGLWWFVIKGNENKIISAIGVMIITASLCIPMARFSYDRIGVMTSFSYGGLNKIYALSGESKIEIHINDKTWWFESPTYYTQPFDPISKFELPHSGPYQFTIDTSHGTKDWNEEIRKLKGSYSFQDYLNRIRNNVIYATFATSWPDSGNNQGDGFWLRSGYHLRWVWAPLMIIVAIGALKQKLDQRQMIFVLATLGLIAMLFIQNEGIMEGRYRKPVEPMLIISAIIVALSLKRGDTRGQEFLTAFEHANVFLRRLFANFKNNQSVHSVIDK